MSKKLMIKMFFAYLGLCVFFFTPLAPMTFLVLWALEAKYPGFMVFTVFAAAFAVKTILLIKKGVRMLWKKRP